MRYRVSYPEKLAVDDLVNGNPYCWQRTLSPDARRLYARAWLWFKPMTQDQHELRALYLDEAHADLGIVESFSVSRFLLAWGALFAVLYVIGILFRMILQSL